MKKIFVFVLLTQLTYVCLYAQGNSNVEKTKVFKEKNQKVITLFKLQDFKEAQKVAVEVLDLALEIFGENNNETAISYRNLGEVLRMRKKFDEAVVQFDKALAIYQKKPGENVDRIIDVLESKGSALAFDGKEDEAESVFAQHLAIVEGKLGKESLEILPYLKTQTDFYLYLKNFDKADDLFIRRQIISAESKAEKLETEISDGTLCYLHQNLNEKEFREREKKISDAVSLALESEKSDSALSEKGKPKVDREIVNGKALNLAKPDYPSAARSSRIGGKVLVKVVIGNDGIIKSAEGFCGPEVLRKPSEDTAFRSKFKPTLVDGEVIEVKGIIVYNYRTF